MHFFVYMVGTLSSVVLGIVLIIAMSYLLCQTLGLGILGAALSVFVAILTIAGVLTFIGWLCNYVLTKKFGF